MGCLEIFDKFVELTIYMITSSSTGTIYKVFEIKKHPFLLIEIWIQFNLNLKKILAEAGLELTDAELDQVAGGFMGNPKNPDQETIV